MTPLWLSHHREADLDRCVRVAGAQLCARCLGLWPALIAAFLVPPSPAAWADRAAAALLPLPGLCDWALARLGRRRGTNAGRLVTGALAGAGLGRGALLWAASADPWVLGVLAALGLVAAAAAVEAARRRR